MNQDKLAGVMRSCGLHLDSDQMAFVTASLTDPGHHCGQAVPGSGKTTCLITMILYLLRAEGVKLSEILCMSFNTDTKNMLCERLARATNATTPKKYFRLSRTYHSVGREICEDVLGRRNFIGKTGARASYVRDSMRLYTERYKEPYPGDMQYALEAIGYMKNVGCYVSDPTLRYPKVVITERAVANLGINAGELERILLTYEKAKGDVCDMDDMLVLPYASYLNGDNPFARSKMSDIKWVFLDEVQDSNEPQMGMIQAFAQGVEDCRIVGIGDVMQCVVADTQVTMADGSTKEAQSVCQGDEVCARFGAQRRSPAKVNAVYRRWVTDLGITCIRTESGKTLKTTHEHMHFATFPKERTTHRAWFTYLMRKGDWFRVGVTLLYNKAGENNSIGTLGHRGRTASEAADGIWIIATHESEAEARLHEAFLAAKYGLPTMMFRARPCDKNTGISGNQEMIDRLFASLDTKTAAMRLLEDFHMFFDRPHHAPKCTAAFRPRNVTLTLCGDSRKENCSPGHRISVITSDHDVAKRIAELGFSVRPSKKAGSWRHETANISFDTIFQHAEKMGAVLGTNPVFMASLGAGGSMPMTPASHVRTHMAVWNENGERERVTEVWTETYTGFVYDFNVDRVHNFVANGIVTHNSIYAWRGAGTHCMEDFVEKFSATSHGVTYNYRSGKHILDAAVAVAKTKPGMSDYVIKPFRQDNGGVYEIQTRDCVGEAATVMEAIKYLSYSYNWNQITVLSRTNAVLGNLARYMWQHQIPVVCRTEDMHDSGAQLLNVVAAVTGNPNANMQGVLESVRMVGPKRAEMVCRRGKGLDDLDPSQISWRKVADRVHSFVCKLKDIRDKIQQRNTPWRDYPVFKNIVARCRGALYDLISDYDAVSGVNMRAEIEASSDMVLEMAKQENPEKAIMTIYDMYDARLDAGRANAVRFSTVHRDKGQENEVVIITDGDNFPCVYAEPGTETYDQETNLLFVAMTRAKQVLIVSRWPHYMQNEVRTSHLYDQVRFDKKMEYKTSPQIAKEIAESITLPAARKSRQADPLPIPRTDTQTHDRWTKVEPVTDSMRGLALHNFKHQLVDAVSAQGYTLDTHRPAPGWYEAAMDEQVVPGAADMFGANENSEQELVGMLKAEYAQAMAKNAPEASKTAWLRKANCILAKLFGDGWLPDIFVNPTAYQRLRIQYDTTTTPDTFPRKHSPGACCARTFSVVAEVLGRHQLSARILVRASEVVAWIDTAAESSARIARIESRPLFGPIPCLVWQSDRTWKRSKDEGFAMALETLLAMRSLANQVAAGNDNRSLNYGSGCWSIPVCGHTWIYNPSDCVWPFHPPDLVLVEKTIEHVRPTHHDKDSADKKDLFQNHADKFTHLNPTVDMAKWEQANADFMRSMMKPKELEWLVSQACGVAAKEVSCHGSGQRVNFRLPVADWVRIPAGDFERDLSVALKMQCTARQQ